MSGRQSGPDPAGGGARRARRRADQRRGGALVVLAGPCRWSSRTSSGPARVAAAAAARRRRPLPQRACWCCGCSPRPPRWCWPRRWCSTCSARTSGRSVLVAIGVMFVVLVRRGRRRPAHPRAPARRGDRARRPRAWCSASAGCSDPLPQLLILIGNALTPGKGFSEGPFSSEAELREMVDLAEASQRDRVRREQDDPLGLRARRHLVREVMVPRTDMVYIERSKTLRQAMSLFLRSGFSRIPVVGEDLDDIVGFAYLKDVSKRVFDRQAAETTEQRRVGDAPGLPRARLQARRRPAARDAGAAPAHRGRRRRVRRHRRHRHDRGHPRGDRRRDHRRVRRRGGRGRGAARRLEPGVRARSRSTTSTRSSASTSRTTRSTPSAV